MRHGDKRFKLGLLAGPRRALLKNLATSILKQGMAAEQGDRAVITTLIKAKAVRSLVERLITYAKKGDLSARRQAAKFVQEPEVLQALFSEIGPRYASRQGGYTRVLKMPGARRGDSAPMALIALVENDVTAKVAPVAAPAAAPQA